MDAAGFDAVVDFALACGVDGVVYPGIASEVGHLADGERATLVARLGARLDGRGPIRRRRLRRDGRRDVRPDRRRRGGRSRGGNGDGSEGDRRGRRHTDRALRRAGRLADPGDASERSPAPSAPALRRACRPHRPRGGRRPLREGGDAALRPEPRRIRAGRCGRCHRRRLRRRGRSIRHRRAGARRSRHRPRSGIADVHAALLRAWARGDAGEARRLFAASLPLAQLAGGVPDPA